MTPFAIVAELLEGEVIVHHPHDGRMETGVRKAGNSDGQVFTDRCQLSFSRRADGHRKLAVWRGQNADSGCAFQRGTKRLDGDRMDVDRIWCAPTALL